MIVDAHMHIWRKINGLTAPKVRVKPLKNGMITIGGQPMLGMPATHLDCSSRAEQVVAEFDAAGVDTGVVVQETMDGPQNDYLLQVQKKFRDRFFMHALPNYFKPATVAREAMALLNRGFRGVKLPAVRLSNIMPLHDERLMPIYDALAERDLVLAVDLSVGAEQVPHMQIILKRHPKLRVAIGHFGLVTRSGSGGPDEWLQQIRLARHENVYIESGGIIWLFRGEGYPFPGAIMAIHRARAEVGIEKLMWGSDWPRTMVDFTYRQSIDFVRRDASLTDSDKALFLGGNAARLYKLKPPKKERRAVELVTNG